MHFLEYRVPSALEQVRQVLGIPLKKTDIRLVNHLISEQSKAILAVPAPATRLGIRDRTMIHLAVSAGLRVSELVGLRLDEVSFQANYVDVHVRGKGRKDRVLSLWKEVSVSIQTWMDVRGEARDPKIVISTGRSGVYSDFRTGFSMSHNEYAVDFTGSSGWVGLFSRDRVAG
jgi:integrase/recombinase XerD